jgi:hypothetical protein
MPPTIAGQLAVLRGDLNGEEEGDLEPATGEDSGEGTPLLLFSLSV